MTADAVDATKEPRQPHTVYLTAGLWAELERRYLQQRLDGGTESKIALIERILWDGLAVSASEPGTPAAAVPQAAPRRSKPAAKQPAKPARPRDPKPPTTRPRVATKDGALARLREASDPGKPAMIDSAAPVRNGPSPAT
jgi:hypothetical protein